MPQFISQLKRALRFVEGIKLGGKGERRTMYSTLGGKVRYMLTIIIMTELFQNNSGGS